MVCAVAAFAQREVPLTTNPVLERQHTETLAEMGIAPSALVAARPKTDCTTPDTDAIPVTANEAASLRIRLDTVGFGANGFYQCTNCDALLFGTAFVPVDGEGDPVDSLTYRANPTAVANVDTVRVRYCNADGSTCSPEQTYVFLARRRGANTFPPLTILAQGELRNFTMTNALPGALQCSFFADCPSEYPGRNQLKYLANYDAPTNAFTYRADRFAGLDSVCLVLCDTFGICDTAHYAIRVDVSPILPPIFDDFSYEGIQPDPDLWLDAEAFVNRTMAIDPPSVGVATFDGLSARGRPYGGGVGQADRLTSTYLNTTGGSWTLSFWLQRGGIADRPETQDSMFLQFIDDGGNWHTVRTFSGMAANVPFSVKDTFAFYSHSISALEDFRHSRFQFRFVNISDRSGFRDNWHLDYVRVDNNPTGSSTFNDVAFMNMPGFILKNYSSMPWRHFQPLLAAELDPEVRTGVYNHFLGAQNVNPSTVRILEESTGINPVGIIPTLFNGLEANTERGVPLNRTYSFMGDATGFPNVWNAYTTAMGSGAFGDGAELRFNTRYTLQNNSQDNQPFVRRNDQVERETRFSNYFAYDDGTAESALETSAGNQIAVAYTAGVADSIQGVRMHFPNANNDFTNQNFRLRIWIGELDNSPEYSMVLQPDFASTFFDTLQGFTSYPLVDAAGDRAPLAIPAGTFYVGWQQASACEFGSCVAVGYDRNQPQGRDFIFVENGQGWRPISGVTDGALMLRPVVSGGDPVFPTALEEPLAEQATVTLFPNPTRHQLTIRTTAAAPTGIRVFNAAGQMVMQQPYAETLDINHLPAGMYWLRLATTDGLLPAQRFVIIQN